VGSGQDRADPSVLAVFHDYIKLMPLVEEANQMSQELGKVRKASPWLLWVTLVLHVIEHE